MTEVSLEVTQNKPLSYNALANLFQVLAGAVLSFVLYRYINDTLGVALLGVWSVVLASASATRLADLGLSASVTRFVALHLARNAQETAARVIETVILSLVLLLGLLLPFLFWLLWQLLSYLFDAGHLADARTLLPYALASLWLTMVASVVQSGLDGCQRMDLRARLVILGQMLMVALSFLLIPGMGLIGLAWAQIGQSFFLLVAGWWALRGSLLGLQRVPRHWSWTLLREMLGYGTNVQVASLFMLIFDPLTKALMARYGGASAAGYFEMANQVVLKVRAFIVAANQAVVPRITQIVETAPEKLDELYRQNMRVLTFVALPVFALLYAWSGLLSWLLVGHVHAQLLFLLQLNAIAWLLNLFAAPAYFANLGTGQVGWNTLSHAIMGLLNGGLGWFVGQRFGAEGVAWAYAVALTVGSWILIIVYQWRSGVGLRELALAEHGRLAAMCVITAVIGHFGWRVMAENVIFWGGVLIIAPLCLGIVVWRHPMRVALWNHLVPLTLWARR